MVPFRGVDFIEFDSLLSEQELMVRQTARRFVDERAIPIIKEHFREARFPMHLIEEMAQLGFFGANLELGLVFALLIAPIYIMVIANMINVHAGYNGLITGTSWIILLAIIINPYCTIIFTNNKTLHTCNLFCNPNRII